MEKKSKKFIPWLLIVVGLGIGVIVGYPLFRYVLSPQESYNLVIILLVCLIFIFSLILIITIRPQSVADFIRKLLGVENKFIRLLLLVIVVVGIGIGMAVGYPLFRYVLSP